MLSGQFAGAVGFISIVCVLGGLAWSLVSGNLAPFRYLACGFGGLLALAAAALAVTLLLDTFGRYERAATVLSAGRGRAEDSNHRAPIDVHFTYEAAGKRRDGYRYAPVELLLESAEMESRLALLRSGQAVAYVSYFDPDNVVLDRALGTRAAAFSAAMIGAWVLLTVFRKTAMH